AASGMKPHSGSRIAAKRRKSDRVKNRMAMVGGQRPLETAAKSGSQTTSPPRAYGRLYGNIRPPIFCAFLRLIPAWVHSSLNLFCLASAASALSAVEKRPAVAPLLSRGTHHHLRRVCEILPGLLRGGR